MSAARIVNKLDDLLNRQAACLKAGDIAGAFAVGPAIERLVDRLEAERNPVPSVAGLKDLAAKNAGLIKAAQRGVAAAREMIQASGAQDSFQTYDAQGRASRIGPQT